MREAKFGNYEELLKSLSELSTAEAHLLAVRNSVRVMPMFFAEPIPQAHERTFLLGVFRCNVTAYASHLSDARTFSREAIQAADDLIQKIKFPNELFALCAAVFCAEAVDEKKSTYLSLEGSADAIEAYSLEREFWQAVAEDFEVLREGGVVSLIDRPLWQSVAASERMAGTFRSYVEDFGQNWIVLSDWYSAITKRGVDDILREFHNIVASYEERFWQGTSENILHKISDIWTATVSKNSRLDSPPRAATHGVTPVDFFISYSSNDEPFAREISDYLEKAGYSTIVQYKDFPVGSNFVIEMQEGLERGARAVALLSPSYVASDHCRAEWAAVYNADPLGKGRKLIPLLLKPANLNKLARQIVYKSLFGLVGDDRRAAVLDAIGHKTNPLPPDLLQKRLAEIASPDVASTADGRLDAVPNATYDHPVFDTDLPDLPETLRTLCNVIHASLPENSPKTIGPSLNAYGSHLTERGARPIVGLLSMLADALHRDVRSAEFDVWGDGLATHFDNFFSCHSKFITHFPKAQDREEAMLANEIDEERASGKNFLDPVKNVTEALTELHLIGGTTPAFERVVQDSLQRAKDIDSLPMLSDTGAGTDVTPKRRFVFTHVGFWERVLSALGSMTTLASTEQGRIAIAALTEAIKKFLSFISVS